MNKTSKVLHFKAQIFVIQYQKLNKGLQLLGVWPKMYLTKYLQTWFNWLCGSPVNVPKIRHHFYTKRNNFYSCYLRKIKYVKVSKTMHRKDTVILAALVWSNVFLILYQMERKVEIKSYKIETFASLQGIRNKRQNKLFQRNDENQIHPRRKFPACNVA